MWSGSYVEPWLYGPASERAAVLPWLSIRSFPLRPDIPEPKARALRSSQIQLLKKLMLFQFVSSFGQYPKGNTARTGIKLIRLDGQQER